MIASVRAFRDGECPRLAAEIAAFTRHFFHHQARTKAPWLRLDRAGALASYQAMNEPPIPAPHIPPQPVLLTDRLLLRPHRPSDFDACCALWGDAEVVRHIGGAVQESQTVWFRILRYAGMWSLLGYGMWVLEERATGAFLGEAGLLSACRGLRELDGVPEAGWVLGPEAWGRGFASEAMGAILAWADVDLAAPSIRCIIEDGNDASVRVAEKLGFRKFADAVLHDAPIGVFDRASGVA